MADLIDALNGARFCRRCRETLVHLVDKDGVHVGWASAGKAVNARECPAAPGHTHSLTGPSGPIAWEASRG